MDPDSASSAPPTDDAVAAISLAAFTAYLRDVVVLVIGGSEGQLATALANRDNAQVLQHFIEDPQTPCLYISRTLTKEEDGVEDEAADKDADKEVQTLPPFSVTNQIEYHSPRLASVALLKKGSVIGAEKPVASQVHVVTFAAGAPYEVLHTYVHNAVLPYFNSAVTAQRQTDKLGECHVLLWII